MAVAVLYSGVVLSLVWVSGCLSAPVLETPPVADPATGDIYIELVASRSFWSHGEIYVHVTTPSGVTKQGTVGTHYQDFVDGIPRDEWPDRVSGDVQERRPGEIGPYPYILFEDVEFNGTWRLEFRLLEASTPWEDASTVNDPRETYCSHFHLSLPDHVPMNGRHAGSRHAFSDAVVFFEWSTKEVVPGPGAPGCRSEPR
jgi:hypothetical protein